MQNVRHRKKYEGVVSSNKMEKTIGVSINELVRHPVYGKTIRRTKKVLAHDNENLCEIGDEVMIEETRPLSKNKCWRLVKITKKAILK